MSAGVWENPGNSLVAFRLPEREMVPGNSLVAFRLPEREIVPGNSLVAFRLPEREMVPGNSLVAFRLPGREGVPDNSLVGFWLPKCVVETSSSVAAGCSLVRPTCKASDSAVALKLAGCS